MTTPSSLPFSPLRIVNGFVNLSGEMAHREDGSMPEGIEAQTTATLDNIAETLATVGLDLSDVVTCLVHLKNPGDFAAYNGVYKTRFKAPLPTRTTVAATLLDPNGLIEITVVAAQRS